MITQYMVTAVKFGHTNVATQNVQLETKQYIMLIIDIYIYSIH